MSEHRHFSLLATSVLAMIGIGAVVARAQAPKATTEADSHLVGWWRFDETSGTSAADSSKQARKGTLEGGLSFDIASVPGRVGKAIQFGGRNQCIQITGFKGVSGTQARTVCAWVKTKSPGGEIVSWGLNDAGKMFIVSFIRARIGTTPKGGYLYMKAGVDDDVWHHVAVVVHEASPPNLHDHVKLYRDGEVAEIDDIGLLDLWPIDTGEKQDVTIGRQFKGAIDELRIYDRALTDDEVAALHKMESGGAAK